MPFSMIDDEQNTRGCAFYDLLVFLAVHYSLTEIEGTKIDFLL